MAKVRVYEIARETGIPNRQLVEKIRALGIEAKNHMSSLDSEAADHVRRSLERERQESLVERRVGSTVIRRRSKSSRRRPASVPETPLESAPAPAEVAPAAAAPEGPAEVAPAAGDAPLEPGASPEEVAEAEPHAQEAEAGGARAATPPSEEPRVAAQPASAAGAPEPLEVEPPDARAAEEGAESVSAAPEEGGVGTEPAPVEAPAPEEAPAAAEAPAPVEAPAAAEAPAAVEESQEEKLGPTGRFIDLRKAGVPKVVITEVGQTRPGAPRGRREYFPGRDRRGPPGRFGGGGGRGAKGRRRQMKRSSGPAKQTEITVPAEHKRRIRMEDAISTGDLAKQMGIKATDVLKKLWGLGMTGITINSTLDYETAGVLAAEFGFEVENVAFHEEAILNVEEDVDENQQPRPPVVTIMGHVDHGKTSLLDAIRKSDIVGGEAGGITQHIGAYKVKTKHGEIVFIDTPGHEAFSAMRARGANATDLVVLVVAADDGVMPQTREAIQHSQAAEVPILVAVNKIDKADAQPERIKQDMTAFNLVPEDWGGDTIFCEVSAVTKKGLDNLLEMISFQAEMLDLKANPEKLPKGVVLEAQLDKARGPVATVVVQEGTLRPGDIIVAGENYARVRALVDDRGRTIKEAPPSTPVQVLGLNGVPEAGEIFNGVKDEKDAKRVASHREEQRRRKELAAAGPGTSLLERLAKGEQKELRVVLKADQQGTAEAVREALTKLSTEKVDLSVVGAGVGAVTESDVNMAKAADALVVGFHVRPTKQARELAERERVEIRRYNIIYELLDDVRDAMRGLLPKEQREKVVGRIEVRDTFTIPKIGTIAGCFVLDGKVHRNAYLRVYRNNVQIYEGKVSSLRRFKEDVKEVEKGYECGLGVENFNDIKVEDLVEAYEIEEFAAEL